MPVQLKAGRAGGRRGLRMEFFYREMRRKTGWLMDGDEPKGESGTTTRRTGRHHLLMSPRHPDGSFPRMPAERRERIMQQGEESRARLDSRNA